MDLQSGVVQFQLSGAMWPCLGLDFVKACKDRAEMVGCSATLTICFGVMGV